HQKLEQFGGDAMAAIDSILRAGTPGAPEELPPEQGEPVEPEPEPITFRRELPKVGRNDLCPCGSGKKYKKCCGKE
ncbi:MAG: SEC-C metal-binding domain-containing protein, partial [Victivallaceae bacterium]|nr:SEC-C metal-binding domain-containing protein [Victivallaceae bacterium]